MKILITGSRGQLGSELADTMPAKHEIYGYDLEMDVTDLSCIEKEISSVRPHMVIHCAAYTDVDGCELNLEKAMAVNSVGTQNLAVLAKKYGAGMVYISTDYVFDGCKRQPYIETDKPNPISVYGMSKLKGEIAVAGTLENYYILRTTGIYSRYGKNFVDTIIKNSKAHKTLKIVEDQVCTPTYSRDVAECIFRLIESREYGIYHGSNNGSCSWYEFSVTILKILGLDAEIIPIKSSGLDRAARRPAYSVLENRNLERRGILKMRSWQEALKDFLVN